MAISFGRIGFIWISRADEIARLQYGDDYDAEVTDLFEAIETKINAYVKGAVVIPLDVATTADVHQLESEGSGAKLKLSVDQSDCV